MRMKKRLDSTRFAKMLWGSRDLWAVLAAVEDQHDQQLSEGVEAGTERMVEKRGNFMGKKGA